MKQKNIILLTLLGLGLAAGLLLAANETVPPPAPPMDPIREVIRDRIFAKLGLSAEQQKSIDALVAERDAALAAVRGDTSLAPEAKREKGRTLFMDYRTKMLAVLTPDQQKQAAAWRDQGGRRPEGPGWAQHAPPPPGRRDLDEGRARVRHPLAIVALGERIKDRIAAKLGLTDEQRDKLEHLGRAYRAQQREAMKKHFEEMRAVLTPEQQQKLDAWKQHRQHQPGAGPRFGFDSEDTPDGPMVAFNEDDSGAPDDLD